MRGKDSVDKLLAALGAAGAVIVTLLVLVLGTGMVWQGGASPSPAMSQPSSAAGGSISGTFDHFRTGFPLTDGHRNVACESCHMGGVFKSAPRTCSGCHDNRMAPGKPNKHIPTNSACDTCHNVKNWTVIRFQHSQTSATCVSCHNNFIVPGKPPTHFATNGACDACHITANWTTLHFDHSQVTGACATCHNGTTATGKSATHIATTGA